MPESAVRATICRVESAAEWSRRTWRVLEHTRRFGIDRKTVTKMLHAVVREGADHRAVLRRIRRLLAARFGVEHATIQLEPGRRLDG